MTRLLKLVLTIFAILTFSLVTAQAQDSADFARLVSKDDRSQFNVEGAHKIDHIEALELKGKGVTFIDVRRTIQYQAGHIPGAIGLELKSMLTDPRV